MQIPMKSTLNGFKPGGYRATNDSVIRYNLPLTRAFSSFNHTRYINRKRNPQNPKSQTKKMKIFAAILVVLVLASPMGIEALGPDDCLDSCSTGCVNSNERLRSRCERKCTIKCGPDAETQKLVGG